VVDVDVDVVVVGAGLSGVGAACRLQTLCPGRTFTVLEARDTIGGTWDLFRYPGIRSDSDFFTLSYPFRPWHGRGSIVDGASILEYVEDTARAYGVDRHIRFRTRVVAADWSSADARWTLTLREETADGPRETTLTCSFLYACAGYYDYEQAHQPPFPGIEQYVGTVVVPQFWPDGLEVAGRRVVIIGSGATAVTLAPALAATAEHVTVLQRSPTWIGAVPAEDALANRIRAVLPAGAAHRLIRGKNIVRQQALYAFCTRWPRLARRLLLGLTVKALDDPALVDEHFTPAYDPWEQRFCVAPDGDFFRAIRRGTLDVVTDRVDRFEPGGIRLAGGRVLAADIVVSATGLQMLAFGGIALSVDTVPVDLHERFVWQGAMLTGVPNFAVAVGYVNASWTLRADLTSRLVCRVLDEMARRRATSVVPVPDPDLEPRPLLPLSSGYIQRALDQFPQQGDRGPWRVRQNYLLDAALTLRRGLGRTLRFDGPGDPAAPEAVVSRPGRAADPGR